MKNTLLTLRAGQRGSLSFTFSNAPADATLTLIGGARHKFTGATIPFARTADAALLIPALPVGVYDYEVRVGGLTALFGTLEVLPSPCAGAEGVVAWNVEHDYLAQPLAHVTVNITATGPKGADGLNGADGADGAPGAPGLSAYEIAVQNGFSGSQAEWLDSLRVPANPEAVITRRRPTATFAPESAAQGEEREASCLLLSHTHNPGGRLVSITLYPTRGSDAPVYLRLAETTSDTGTDYSANTAVSRNAVLLTAGEPAVFEFSGHDLLGHNLSLKLQAEQSAAWGANVYLYLNFMPSDDGLDGYLKNNARTGGRAAAAIIQTEEEVTALLVTEAQKQKLLSLLA